jgi:hypothetical protein
MKVFATSCTATARAIGLRTSNSQAGKTYHNPFPEHYAVAEAVKRLRAAGFRVMPEAVRHEVFRLGGAGPGSPGKKPPRGRYDLVAWSKTGKPLAALELKWQWSNIEDDANALRVINSKINCHSFVGIMAVHDTKQGVHGVLENRIGTLRTLKLDIVSERFSQAVDCKCFEAGSNVKSKIFQAAIMQIVAK